MTEKAGGETVKGEKKTAPSWERWMSDPPGTWGAPPIEYVDAHVYVRASTPVFTDDRRSFTVVPGCSCGWKFEKAVDRWLADAIFKEHLSR